MTNSEARKRAQEHQAQAATTGLDEDQLETEARLRNALRDLGAPDPLRLSVGLAPLVHAWISGGTAAVGELADDLMFGHTEPNIEWARLYARRYWAFGHEPASQAALTLLVQPWHPSEVAARLRELAVQKAGPRVAPGSPAADEFAFWTRVAVEVVDLLDASDTGSAS